MSDQIPLHTGPDLNHVRFRIGLISDTHMPLRRRALPPELFDLFRGVDLILHAGDVGELWVLDQLSAIAPVIAVHGNDDSDEAQTELPYQQVIAAAGLRILLWHSHFPDRDIEMDSRRPNAISPARNLERARRAGAQVVVFGHWHIPFVHRQDGICVINPGALASGNLFSRQTVASVALLTIDITGQTYVRHIDLADPDRSFAPTIAWEAGFAANLMQYHAPIVTPELHRAVAYLHGHLSYAEVYALIPSISGLAHAVWDGHTDKITLEQVQTAITVDSTIPTVLKSRLTELFTSFQAT